MIRNLLPRSTFGLALAIIISGAAVAQDMAGSLLQHVSRSQNYIAGRDSSGHPDLSRNADAKPIEPGETLVLAELEGPGAITSIWTTVGSFDPFHGRSLVVRIYWDGNEHPSVEAPLGDFFGVGHGAASDFTSLPVQVSSHGRSRNAYWYMPFRESAKVTVTNESPEYRCGSFYYYLNWRKYESAPEDMMYFHAQYRQEMPAQPGDYVILETEGRGHYVGTVYSAQQVEIGWFGEGDDRFYIDGEEYPSIRGTGTEDYFGDAWGFRKLETPFHGVSLWEGYFPGDRVTAYRWHLPDPIPFTESLRVEIQTYGSIFTGEGIHLGQFIERPDWVSSVAFWYQDEPRGLTDGIAPQPDRIAPYIVFAGTDLNYTYEQPGMLETSGPTVTYAPGRPDGAIEFEFELEEAGTYQFNGILWHSVMSGPYQPYLNGEPFGPVIDFCVDGSDQLWTSFDIVDLEAGRHTLRFEGRGPSPNMRSLAPPLHGFGLTYLVLLRLQDLEGYQQAMKAELERRGN